MQSQSPKTLIPASSDLCRALHIHGFIQSSYSRTLRCSVLSLWSTFLTLCLHIFHFILITSQDPRPSWRVQTFLLQTFKKPYIQGRVHTCKYLYNSQIYQSSSVAREFPVDRSRTCFPYHSILCLIIYTPFINNCWMNKKFKRMTKWSLAIHLLKYKVLQL